jgi:hypothetical protein
MAPTETQENPPGHDDLATKQDSPRRRATDAQHPENRQDQEHRVFIRGFIIGIVASIPLWVVIAIAAIWLLR